MLPASVSPFLFCDFGLCPFLPRHSPFRQHKTKDKHEIDRMTLTMVSVGFQPRDAVWSPWGHSGVGVSWYQGHGLLVLTSNDLGPLIPTLTSCPVGFFPVLSEQTCPLGSGE